MPERRRIYFVHGFASSFEGDWGRTGWVDILRDFGVEAIPVNLPGHGDPDASTDPKRYVDCEGLIWSQFRHDAPITAVGFSQGADLLLRVACAHPEAFDRLVLLGLGDRVLMAHEFGDLAAALKADREPEDVRLRLFWRLASANDAPNGALAAFLERDRQALVVPDSLQLRFPILSIIGSEEGISQDELALMIRQLETHVVSGVDHFGLPGNIDVITKTIDFLDL